MQKNSICSMILSFTVILSFYILILSSFHDFSFYSDSLFSLYVHNNVFILYFA